MNKPQETRLVHCFDMLTFVTEIEKAVNDGFSLDLKNNEHCPVQIGFQYIATMVKEVIEGVRPAVESTTEGGKTAQEALESVQLCTGSQEVNKEVVEAPKRAETAVQDVKAKPGRKAKSE